MRSFNDYWSEEGCRMCVDTHEDRAALAWAAAIESVIDQLLPEINYELYTRNPPETLPNM